VPAIDVWALITVAVIALLVTGALAPIETLGWWAGWYGRYREDIPEPLSQATPPAANHFVVFLTGIHTVSGTTFAGREINLLKELRARLSDVAILEVFPYSVTNRALTGQRVFAWFWRWALTMKLKKTLMAKIAGMVINLRNTWQVAVSADRRYGPIYNHGSAEIILEQLLQNGYQIGSGARVTLIGYSGGSQIALGAASYLKQMVKSPVDIISFGGIMSADPGLLEIDHFYHLTGERDRIQRIGYIFFPGRWPLLTYSAWNQAKMHGKITTVALGPVDHTGREGYLDSKKTLADGRSFLQQTVDTIAVIVEKSRLTPLDGFEERSHSESGLGRS
jgi:hypothetical protein